MSFNLTLSMWAEMSEQQQRAFKALIEQGGEVCSSSLAGLLDRARRLGFAVDDANVMQAVAALKTPNTSYRDKVFSKAGATAEASGFSAELGWIYVAPSSRGHRLGERLSAALVGQEKGPVYATSSEDNEHRRVHAMLQRLDFVKEGRPYEGASGRMISLFIRQTSGYPG